MIFTKSFFFNFAEVLAKTVANAYAYANDCSYSTDDITNPIGDPSDLEVTKDFKKMVINLN